MALPAVRSILSFCERHVAPLHQGPVNLMVLPCLLLKFSSLVSNEVMKSSVLLVSKASSNFMTLWDGPAEHFEAVLDLGNQLVGLYGVLLGGISMG